MGIAVTNNPMVRDALSGQGVEFYDTDFLGVLIAVRDKIHQNHRLLTHPLSGSVKPGETPYKTVLVSAEKSGFDEKALSIIEESIQTCLKFTESCVKRDLSAKILKDFQLIDYSLVFSDR
ncbi:MAG: GrdX family protein [Treponema sp.]|nr:GrdX family protein [Treponema sp.]